VDYVKTAASTNIIGFRSGPEKASAFGKMASDFMADQARAIAGYLL